KFTLRRVQEGLRGVLLLPPDPILPDYAEGTDALPDGRRIRATPGSDHARLRSRSCCPDRRGNGDDRAGCGRHYPGDRDKPGGDEAPVGIAGEALTGSPPPGHASRAGP